MSKPETLMIDDIKYVRADQLEKKAESYEGMDYCMIRTCSSGVFMGYLANREGGEGTIKKARRIWYWDGAASLSQLATDGTSKPQSCKFPCEVEEITLLNIIEIIPMTAKAKESLNAVKVWSE